MIRLPLLLALLDLYVTLILLLSVYHWTAGVYVMTHLPVMIIVLVFPVLLIGLLWVDILECKDLAHPDCNQSFTVRGGHALLFVLTMTILVLFTALSIIDTRK
jgi:hypothetical protein